MARQGDVLLVAVTHEPGGCAKVAKEDGDIVLAHGEATGHRHRIRSRHATLVEAPSGDRFLRVTAPVQLLHEEHAPISTPPGLYRVVRQREYHPDLLRLVED